MEITADFDGGNVIVDKVKGPSASLRIRPDSNAPFFQWFYFRAEGVAGETRQFAIGNAAHASYPGAWPRYRVLASADHINWQRLPTNYVNGVLTFTHERAPETASYAFFVPYPETRRRALLTVATGTPGVERRSIGRSVQGRSLDMLVFGEETGGERIWVIARQHAGEPMAEWAAEGLVRRLLDQDDEVATELKARTTISVIPNANPDGSALGNLRANADGVDLNRDWKEAASASPEVAAIKRAVEHDGVDYFIDIHGDETRPYIWVVPSAVHLDPAAARKALHFVLELARLQPELQPPPVGIEGEDAAEAGMSVNFIATTFGCPAWTLELPFPEVPGFGDSLLADGCMRFGRSCIEALNVVIGSGK
ncbi:MAG: M14-type cytosolic carboxypeptidase [Anaerolineaceae bacterium]|nr:M14-type cytosolic carboxypeptidase [Anaerolineaceae bacterium]